jgi:hypothetical protein
MLGKGPARFFRLSPAGVRAATPVGFDVLGGPGDPVLGRGKRRPPLSSEARLDRPALAFVGERPRSHATLRMCIMQEESLGVPDLGLVLDASLHRATRGKRSVEFHGNRKRWEVLVKLAKCYPLACPIDELLKAVWSDADPAYKARNRNTVHTTVHALREMLGPLGLTVTNSRSWGYRLEAGRKRSARRDPHRRRHGGRLAARRRRRRQSNPGQH